MTRPAPPWFAEARALYDAGSTVEAIGAQLGKRRQHVKVALDIGGARQKAKDANASYRADRREGRAAKPKGQPIAGTQTPREVLKAALAAYQAGEIEMREMVRLMAGAV
jgi:hypothetical protein